MKDFIKITEDLYYSLKEKNKDISPYLCKKVDSILKGNTFNHSISMEECLIGCESPIEQMLAIEMDWINLLQIANYNPYIDVLAIENQAEVKCGKNKYRVDFHIPVLYRNQGIIDFVIECDGYEFHQKTKEQVAKDNIRQRELQKAGYEIIRFSGTEIWHKPFPCAHEVKNIIMSKCNYISDSEVK